VQLCKKGKKNVIYFFFKEEANADQQEAQNLMNSYYRISKANAEQIETLNKELGLNHTTKLGSPNCEQHRNVKRIKLEEMNIPPPIPLSNDFDANSISAAAAAAAAASMNAGSLIGSPLKTADGLTFVTLGRLSSNMSVRDNKPAIEIMAADQTPTLGTSLQRPTVGMKRKPSSGLSSQVSWTVPPRILLVDDDSVYRDLSERLLHVFGCTIDLAKDGVEALKKMGLERYDLILMVRKKAAVCYNLLLLKLCFMFRIL
jgi:osomolarity two-component system response regulator SKN7